jgi:hypothetical protein
MDIKGLPHLDVIQGIAFCAVLEPICEGPFNEVDVESKNVWYEYFIEESFELKRDFTVVCKLSCLQLYSCSSEVSEFILYTSMKRMRKIIQM